jgi:hypothetical protein
MKSYHSVYIPPNKEVLDASAVLTHRDLLRDNAHYITILEIGVLHTPDRSLLRCVIVHLVRLCHVLMRQARGC